MGRRGYLAANVSNCACRPERRCPVTAPSRRYSDAPPAMRLPAGPVDVVQQPPSLISTAGAAGPVPLRYRYRDLTLQDARAYVDAAVRAYCPRTAQQS